MSTLRFRRGLGDNRVVVPFFAAGKKCDIDVRKVGMPARRRDNDEDNDKGRDQQGGLQRPRWPLLRFQRSPKLFLNGRRHDGWSVYGRRGAGDPPVKAKWSTS